MGSLAAHIFDAALFPAEFAVFSLKCEIVVPITVGNVTLDWAFGRESAAGGRPGGNKSIEGERGGGDLRYVDNGLRGRSQIGYLLLSTATLPLASSATSTPSTFIDIPEVPAAPLPPR